MKLFVNLLLCLVLLMLISMAFVSCKGTKTVGHSIVSKDSTGTNTEKEHTIKDSTFHSEVTELKTLPSAQVIAMYSKGQIDSLFHLLRNLPKGTVIYRTDPTAQAQLSIMIDSLGNLKFLCKSAEQQYMQTIITQGRMIQELNRQLKEKERSQSTIEETVKEQKRGFWGMVLNGLKNGLIWFIIALVGILVLIIKVKKA